jgi:3-deoxy-7-phosphoheptulonate synthase
MSGENAFPGKDITPQDLRTKFPLVAKQDPAHRSRFTVAGVEFGGDLIPVFAGPNMVESRELILDVAANVKRAGAHFLRGGAFKPLTFPYRNERMFELGEEGLRYLRRAGDEQGLEWMREARERVGIPIITEVMEERFVPLVAESADILQIGSRNMQNFPLITACAKTGKPIMLKRHFGASLRDWLGAAEYILIEGNAKVILCERGVAAPHTHRATSRFLFDLQVVPAAQEVTHLPVVVDPSHATFWRPWVAPMALAGIAAGADGVMLEVHPDPPNAAVDPLQPIDFASFDALMQRMRAVAEAVGRRV